jgi:flagellar basal body rod protein FlgC
MAFLSGMDISGSALSAQRTRMDIFPITLQIQIRLNIKRNMLYLSRLQVTFKNNEQTDRAERQ